MAVDTAELRELLSKATKGLWRKGKPFWTCDPTADPPVCRQHYRHWIDYDHEIWVDRGWDQGYSEVPDTHADMIAGAFGYEGLEYGILHEEDQDLICAAVNALPELLDELETLRAERLSLLETITGQDQDLFAFAKELAALREWKEQAAPTLAAALATLQRVGEGAEKMRERAKPPEGVEWSHQADAYRDCADILKEALGDEDRVQRPPIICLCGSTRFMDAFFEAGWQATLAGKIVLSVGVCKHVDTEGGHGGEMLGPETVAALDELHLRKIDLADQVLILNVGGYIGESTGRELAYARSIGKSVRFLEPPEEEALGDGTSHA